MSISLWRRIREVKDEIMEEQIIQQKIHGIDIAIECVEAISEISKAYDSYPNWKSSLSEREQLDEEIYRIYKKTSTFKFDNIVKLLEILKEE